MKKQVLLFLFFLPFFLQAQKGTIIPDIKPQPAINTSTDTKTWVMESYLVNCLDNTTKCYLIKENGTNKTVPQEDVYDFVFEDGYKYTLLVKEELKAPPVDVLTGIYNYIVIKIISRKQIVDDASAIPTVTTKTITPEVTTPAPAKQQVYVSATGTESDLRDEIDSLRKQLKELKKQVDIIQLQLSMQLQLMQKKE